MKSDGKSTRLHSCPTRRSSDLPSILKRGSFCSRSDTNAAARSSVAFVSRNTESAMAVNEVRWEEHTSALLPYTPLFRSSFDTKARIVLQQVRYQCGGEIFGRVCESKYRIGNGGK